jgi:hypothetical protein
MIEFNEQLIYNFNPHMNSIQVGEAKIKLQYYIEYIEIEYLYIDGDYDGGIFPILKSEYDILLRKYKLTKLLQNVRN